MEKPSVLRDAQDLTVIGQTGDQRDNYVYAVKPSLEIMEAFYELSIAMPLDKNIPAFQQHWKFDKKEGIKGSSTSLVLRFDCRIRPYGLWIPGLLEAKVLESQGKLERGTYGDYGFVIYSNDNPNKQVAEVLVSQAKELGLKLPLIVPFKALNYSVEGKEIKPSFVKSPQGIISGKEAQDEINFLKYHKANSGINGLMHNEIGCWTNCSLDASDDDGRVDWVCGEASRKILGEAYSELSERKYGNRIKELIEEQRLDRDNFEKSLQETQ